MMTVKDCYDRLGIDYEYYREWYPTEKSFLVALSHFCQDQDNRVMDGYMDNGELEKAYFYADNFKDVCINLGFLDIGEKARELCKVLKVKGVAFRDNDEMMREWGWLNIRYREIRDLLLQADWERQETDGWN